MTGLIKGAQIPIRIFTILKTAFIILQLWKECTYLLDVLSQSVVFTILKAAHSQNCKRQTSVIVAFVKNASPCYEFQRY